MRSRIHVRMYLSAVISENFLGVQDISKFPTQSMLPSYLTPFTLNPVSSNLSKKEKKSWNWWILYMFGMVNPHIRFLKIQMEIRQTYHIYTHWGNPSISTVMPQYANHWAQIITNGGTKTNGQVFGLSSFLSPMSPNTRAVSLNYIPNKWTDITCKFYFKVENNIMHY